MKRLLSFLLAGAAALAMTFTASGEALMPEELLTDNAGLLNSSEKKSVLDALEEVSDKYGVSVMVYTADSLGDDTPAAYSDYLLNTYLDTNGKDDAIMLLVDMGSRNWYVNTTGKCEEAFTDYGIDEMSEEFLPELSDGDYKKAFDNYADACERYLKEYESGTPYDVNNQPLTAFDYVKKVMFAAFIGLIVAVVVAITLTKQLKSVEPERTADNYIRSGSFKLNVQKDLFLYNSVTKTRRSSSSSGSSGRRSGGSSTRSSGGRSHGGRGGRF